MPLYMPSACNNGLPVVNAQEKAILDNLERVRDELTSLKLDRSTYIKTPDITSLFDRTNKQVQLLADVRAVKPEQNDQVDGVLDCCLQLLSLFFMAIGRNNEAPAAYALMSALKRFLDHLAETDLYLSKDLVHISKTLHILRGMIKKATGSYPKSFIDLLSSQIDQCFNTLTCLQNHLNQIGEDLFPIYEELISISSLISFANARENFMLSEFVKLQYKLEKINSQRVAGNFVSANGEILQGSNIVGKLLDDCLAWSELSLKRRGLIPDDFYFTYQMLLDIHDKLARLMLTHAWSLRKTDLNDYQKELDIIDKSRIDGMFFDIKGCQAETYVHRMFLHLIQKSYSYIYYMMVASVPISEGLLPVYNQLQTLKSCLVRAKDSGGISCSRDIYPYNMKLHFFESMRVDGKFRIENVVPEGQANVIYLLEQCYELRHQLQEKVERRENNSYNSD